MGLVPSGNGETPWKTSDREGACPILSQPLRFVLAMNVPGFGGDFQARMPGHASRGKVRSIRASPIFTPAAEFAACGIPAISSGVAARGHLFLTFSAPIVVPRESAPREPS